MSALKVKFLLLLSIVGCSISNIDPLVETLAINRSLKQLHLSGNHFGTSGAKTLAKALRLSSTLEVLAVKDCDLDDAAVDILCGGISACHLKKLIISCKLFSLPLRRRQSVWYARTGDNSEKN
jgi:hypothetical protein